MKQTLVTQSGKMPTRKMLAVILATFLVHGAIAAIHFVLDTVLPGATVEIPAEEWIAALMPLLAGYSVRERG